MIPRQAARRADGAHLQFDQPRRCSKEPIGWPRFPPLPAEECRLPTPLETIGSVYGDDGPSPLSGPPAESIRGRHKKGQNSQLRRFHLPIEAAALVFLAAAARTRIIAADLSNHRIHRAHRRRISPCCLPIGIKFPGADQLSDKSNRPVWPQSEAEPAIRSLQILPPLAVASQPSLDFRVPEPATMNRKAGGRR